LPRRRGINRTFAIIGETERGRSGIQRDQAFIAPVVMMAQLARSPSKNGLFLA